MLVGADDLWILMLRFCDWLTRVLLDFASTGILLRFITVLGSHKNHDAASSLCVSDFCRQQVVE